MNPALKTVIPLTIVAVLLIALLMSLSVVVEAGHVGVLRTLGAVNQTPLKEGLHFKKPFLDQVEQVDVRLTASHAQATAASRDLQTVTTQVTTQYSMNGELAPLTYQKVGNLGKVSAALVEPAIQECVKAVTAKFTAEELVTKRELVKQQIQQALIGYINSTLKEKGLENALLIANVAITDFNFSPEFNRAIESKVQAEQQALQAKNEKLKRVTQAEALASEKTLAADADAYATDVQSKARADAIRREAEALKQSPELIRLRTVEKWDGVLPRVNGGEMVPFLNLNSEIEEKPGR
jgi:regulator of protease activity HflC (stomatin/prohibitin superfamily)